VTENVGLENDAANICKSDILELHHR